MKKQLLLLSLTLALLLSVASVALAADQTPEVYEDDVLRITNVTSAAESWDGLGPGYPMSAVAPVEITTLVEISGIGISDDSYLFDENAEPEYLTWQVKETFVKPPHPAEEEFVRPGATITITEPGTYILDYYICENTHDGDGGNATIGGYAITVLAAGEAKPAEDTKPAEETNKADEQPKALAFVDVQAGDYFAEPVAWAIEQQLTTGTDSSHFSPATDCSIRNILTFLWRGQGRPETAADAQGDEAAAMAWAKEQRIFDADDDEFYQRGCTRAEAVLFMWQTAGSPAADPSGFGDVSDKAVYAQAVAWAVEQGITTGATDTTFEPDTVCTRAQIVTFLYRAAAE